MAKGKTTSRENQRRRTRKDLLDAAARLIRTGRAPTLDEVAEAALVSRATAYRYFSSTESLLAEVSVDIAMPDPAHFFDTFAAEDPVGRLKRLDDAVQEAINANEGALRIMLAHSVQLRLKDGNSGLPARQNRRTPLIEAALDPASARFTRQSQDLLVKALGLVIGTESAIAFKDVLNLDEAESRTVRHWMIDALVSAARQSPGLEKD